MKALELIVYEKEPGRYGREATYNSPDGFWAYPASHVDGYAMDKRLTDAELAAEYWAAAEEATFRHFRAMESYEAQRIEGVTLRFATLPHYDEPTP